MSDPVQVASSEASLRNSHAAEVERSLPHYQTRITWSQAELEEQRTVGLRALLRSAIERSEWHRSRLDGVDLESVTAADLGALPVMTKADLMDNFDAIVSDRRLSRDRCQAHLESSPGEYLLGEFQVVASGGSSGQRGVFVYGWNEWAICYASNVRFSVRDWNEDPTLAGTPRIIAVVAASSATHISAALSKTFSTGVNARQLFPVTLPLGEIVSGLNDLQPTVLMGYSSFLPRLAQEALAGRLRIAPRRIIAISEPLLSESRQLLEEVWRAPVANGYAMSEGMFTGCCGRSIHLPDDLCIVEPVDADGRPVRPGEVSHRILVTNLYNHTQPLIRYEVTDQLAVIAGDCPCGSHLTRIDDPQGRLDDVFVYGNGVTVHPHVFRSALAAVTAIIEYQVRQTATGARVAIVSTDHTDVTSLESKIRDALVKLGLIHPDVSIDAVSELRRLPSGKLKWFIPIAP